MTRTKTILGISLAAVFAVAIMTQASAIEQTITPLADTEVKDNKNTYQKITFSLVEEVKLNGEDFGGYAIFTTDGTSPEDVRDAIAVTTHGPIFYDSEAQIAPTEEQIAVDPYPGPAVVCTGDGNACGPEPHTHLVKAVPSAVCQIAAVGAATFEEPSATVVAKHDNIKVINVQKGTSTFTDAVSGEQIDFTVGANPVDPNPVSGQLGVAFPLVPVPTDDGLVICIGPPTE